MENLQVIELTGQRLLTTKQIAQCYEVEEKRIKQNYSNNRSRFVEGKHYMFLCGTELKEFKEQVENIDLVKNRSSHLYLWTEKGALLHAKSINTDKAWEVYDYLVDFYFRIKKQSQQSSYVQKSVGNPVVDIPENVKIQEALRDVRKYLTAVEVGLDEYSVYRNEDDYNKQKASLMALAIKLHLKISDMLALRPQIVRKV